MHLRLIYLQEKELYKDYFKNLVIMHLIVLILGFTAILGKLISMNAIYMVWYRMLFAAIGLFVYLKVKQINVVIEKKYIMQLLSIGLIVGAHWITFFHAIKVSNISVTLGIFASGTLFVSILEPIILRRKIKWIELVIGICIATGLYLIFKFEFSYYLGILYSLIATILSNLFTILNKLFTSKVSSPVITFYEMIGGFIGITAFLLITNKMDNSMLHPDLMDIFYIAILGIVCTAFAFAVSVQVMKVLSPYDVILSLNMEPIYGILLAVILFGDSELMSLGFYLGTIIILFSVLIYPILNKTR